MAPNREEDLIIIGRTLKTHGLKGSLKIAPFTDRPDRFEPLKSILLETRTGITKKCTLRSAQRLRNQVLIACQEIASVEEAIPFVGGWVKVPRSECGPLAENQFYRFDLIGLGVFGEDGRFFGTLEEIFETKGSDIFVVRAGKKEHLIPAVRPIVKEIDLERKRIVVHAMEGLIEDDAV